MSGLIRIQRGWSPLLTAKIACQAWSPSGSSCLFSGLCSHRNVVTVSQESGPSEFPELSLMSWIAERPGSEVFLGRKRKTAEPTA